MKLKFILVLLLLIAEHSIWAQQDTILLKEVEIKNVREQPHSYKIDYLLPQSIEQSPAKDVGGLLRSIPNVSGIKKGAAGVDPVVRGFKYSQLNVLLNGAIKIEGGCPNRMDPTASHVAVNDVLKVIVVKGPFALKYGPSFGGVINLITWNPVFYSSYRTNLQGMLGVQSNGLGYKSSIKVSGGNQSLTYQASLGYSNYGDYQDGEQRWVKASMKHYNAKANVGYRINKNNIVDAGVDGSFGRDVDFPALSMDEREDNTRVYNLNYRGVNISRSVNIVELKSWLSDVHHLMDNKNRPFSDTVVAVSTINAKDGGVRGSININLKKGVLETGFDYESIYKDGSRVKTMIKQPNLPIKVESIWSNSTINNIGIYSNYQIKQNSLNWMLSGRIDFNYSSSKPIAINGMDGLPFYENSNTSSRFVNMSLSGGFTWNINNNRRLSFSLGRGVRSADMTERFITLFPIGYDNFDYIGNPQLKPEVNYEADLGMFNSSKGNCIFNTNLFFSFVTDFIGSIRVPPSVIRPQTKGVLGVKQFTNFNKVWLTGFEFSFDTPEEKLWQLRLNVAYTFGINPKTTGYTIDNGHITDEYILYNDPLPEIPPLEFNALFQYRLFNSRLLPVVNWRVVAPQRQISQSYGEHQSKAFQIFDIKVNYKFSNNLSLWAGVNNILDAAFYEHLNRNIIGSTLPLYEPGRNFYINFIFNF